MLANAEKVQRKTLLSIALSLGFDFGFRCHIFMRDRNLIDRQEGPPKKKTPSDNRRAIECQKASLSEFALFLSVPFLAALKQ